MVRTGETLERISNYRRKKNLMRDENKGNELIKRNKVLPG